MAPLYVSFYTPQYIDEANALLRTLAEFGLEHRISERPDAGSWERNCAQKPSAIYEAMQSVKGRPIVWLDADARVMRRPALFDELTCDFAAHWLYNAELLSGTLYFGGTEKARSIVRRWVDAQALAPNEWDQRVLQKIVDTNCDGLSVNMLPCEYCWIHGKTKRDMISAAAYGPRDPVIKHLQASRRFRDHREDA